MERRGIYRKGSAGHSRNVSSYKVYRQKFKKWRFPFVLLLALVIVFGTAPIVGEEFQASLITAPETAALVNANPDQARKVILDALHDFVRDCDRFKMEQCVSEGKILVSNVINSKSDLNQFLPVIEKFEDRFSPQLSRSACKFDLGNALITAKSFQKTTSGFMERYGGEFEDAGLSDAAVKLDSAVVFLDKFVESCFAR